MMVEVLRVARVLEMLAKAESAGAVAQENRTEDNVRSRKRVASGYREKIDIPNTVIRGVIAKAIGRSAETMVRAPARAVKLAPLRVEVMFMGGMITWSTT